MAIVVMSASVRDAKTTSSGRVRNTQTVAGYFNQTDETLGDLEDIWQNFVLAVDGVSEGQIIGGGYQILPDLPAGIKGAPVADSDVQEGALFSFNLAGSAYTEGIRIPAFDQSKFLADGQSVNLADADVLSLTGALRGLGIAPLDVSFSNRYADALTTVRAAKKSFRK